MNVSDGWRPVKGQTDYFGQEIPDRIYNNSDYDRNIVLEDRIREVAAQITDYLKATDRMSKTIVFCENEDAAERMRAELAKMNEDMLAQNSDYVVRITGSDVYGKSKLNYFISVREKFPVIATTSELLSTGSDTKMTKVIAIDRNIGSMTLFKQIVGRGTRLREDAGKTSFTLMDFRGVARLFTDPTWDGPIEMVSDFAPGKEVREDPASYDATQDSGEQDPQGTQGTEEPREPRVVPFVREDGCKVFTTLKTVSIYDTDGKLLNQENIIDYTKENVRGQYGDLAKFIRTWSETDKKEAIAEALAQQGIDLDKLKHDMQMDDVDDYDSICHVAYDQKPLTRRERAEGVKKRNFLHRFKDAAREVLEILLDKYMNLGIKEIEKTAVLNLAEFQKYGKPSRIAGLFGGKQGYKDALKELEKELYNDKDKVG